MVSSWTQSAPSTSNEDQGRLLAKKLLVARVLKKVRPGEVDVLGVTDYGAGSGPLGLEERGQIAGRVFHGDRRHHTGPPVLKVGEEGEVGVPTHGLLLDPVRTDDGDVQ